MEGSRQPLGRRFLLGVNYWPSRQGVAMWARWDADAVHRELRALADAGCQVVRFFLRWSHFQPEEDRVDPVALERLRQFCDLAHAVGLGVIPTFFTGHMSGENWDVPWRQGRCPYTDPGMLRAQVRLIQAVAEAIGDHPALRAWDLANEPDIFVRPPSPDAGWLWCRLLYRELKAHTPHVPVTLGIHVTSLADDCGLRPEDIAEAADFVCMHLYPIYSPWCPDPAGTVRPNLLVPFGDRLVAAMARRPALAEEFGSTTLMMSPTLHGRYVSAVLASLLLHGSLGALAWCGLDFACAEELPYDSTPYEVAFGILDAQGRPKPAGEAFGRFARLLRRLPDDLTPAPRPAAILLPERYYDNADPDITPERNFAVLFNAFVLARRAGLPVALVRPDDDWTPYRLLILPCVPRRNSLSNRTWNRLRRWVEAGGTLYLSYDGAALPGMDDVFGITVLDAHPREAVHGPGPWELLLHPAACDPDALLEPDPRAGDARPVARLVPPARSAPRKRLVASPTGARVLGWIRPVRPGGDGDADRDLATWDEPASSDEPAVFVHRYGRGWAVLVTDPLEWILACMPGAYGAGRGTGSETGRPADAAAGGQAASASPAGVPRASASAPARSTTAAWPIASPAAGVAPASASGVTAVPQGKGGEVGSGPTSLQQGGGAWGSVKDAEGRSSPRSRPGTGPLGPEQVYRLAAGLAGIVPEWAADHPDVETGVLVPGAVDGGHQVGKFNPAGSLAPGIIPSPGGQVASSAVPDPSAAPAARYLVVVNHRPEPVTVTLSGRGPAELIDVETGSALACRPTGPRERGRPRWQTPPCRLEPGGWRVFRIAGDSLDAAALSRSRGDGVPS